MTSIEQPHEVGEGGDIELGNRKYDQSSDASAYRRIQMIGNAIVSNPTYDYYEKEEKLQGYLSKQFPTTANPAPLGLCAFALTTFVLSLMNAGGLVCKNKLFNLIPFFCFSKIPFSIL